MAGTVRPDFRPLPACPAGTQDLKLGSHHQHDRSPAQLAWQEAKFRSVAHVSSCKTFRSGWTSQPGRPRVRVRWLIPNLPLVPGELARGEINCCLKKLFDRLLFVAHPSENHENHSGLHLGDTTNRQPSRQILAKVLQDPQRDDFRRYHERGECQDKNRQAPHAEHARAVCETAAETSRKRGSFPQSQENCGEDRSEEKRVNHHVRLCPGAFPQSKQLSFRLILKLNVREQSFDKEVKNRSDQKHRESGSEAASNPLF